MSLKENLIDLASKVPAGFETHEVLRYPRTHLVQHEIDERGRLVVRVFRPKAVVRAVDQSTCGRHHNS